MPGSRSDCARNALPVDAVVVRRRLRALERSLRIQRSLHARGRDALLSDEIVQDRAEWHAQLLAQACADIALHILAGTGTAAPETYAEALSALAADAVIPGPPRRPLRPGRPPAKHPAPRIISTSTTGVSSRSSAGSRAPRSSRRRSSIGSSKTPTIDARDTLTFGAGGPIDLTRLTRPQMHPKGAIDTAAKPSYVV